MPFPCPHCYRSFRTPQTHFWCLTEPELERLIKQHQSPNTDTEASHAAGTPISREPVWHKEDVVIDIVLTDDVVSKATPDTWTVYWQNWCQSWW